MQKHKHISIRFLIGLSCEGDPQCQYGEIHATYAHTIEMRKHRALGILSRVFAFGGSYTGVGYWKGKSEPCMSWETIAEDSKEIRTQARATAGELARWLDQECIGLTFAPVEFETVTL